MLSQLISLSPDLVFFASESLFWSPTSIISATLWLVFRRGFAVLHHFSFGGRLLNWDRHVSLHPTVLIQNVECGSLTARAVLPKPTSQMALREVSSNDHFIKVKLLLGLWLLVAAVLVWAQCV